MSFTRQMVVLDAADVERTAAFWAGFYGGVVVRSDEDWYEIQVGEEFPMAIQLAPDHVPPQWPDGEPQQVHLDFFVDDLQAEHDRVMGLGAQLLRRSGDVEASTGFQVYADPAGHPFCLCWGWETWREHLRARAEGRRG